MTESAAVAPVSTFIVRFWFESSAGGSRWRGQVDHLQSGKTARFLQLDDLTDILRTFGVMEVPPEQADGAFK